MRSVNLQTSRDVSLLGGFCGSRRKHQRVVVSGPYGLKKAFRSAYFPPVSFSSGVGHHAVQRGLVFPFQHCHAFFIHNDLGKKAAQVVKLVRRDRRGLHLVFAAVSQHVSGLLRFAVVVGEGKLAFG